MWIDEAPQVALALLPVLMFLAALRVLDSYKLVSLRTVGTALAAGVVAAAICYGINTVIFRQLHENKDQYIHFGAPLVEELAKGVFWFFLFAPGGVALMFASAICDSP